MGNGTDGGSHMAEGDGAGRVGHTLMSDKEKPFEFILTDIPIHEGRFIYAQKPDLFFPHKAGSLEAHQHNLGKASDRRFISFMERCETVKIYHVKRGEQEGYLLLFPKRGELKMRPLWKVGEVSIFDGKIVIREYTSIDFSDEAFDDEPYDE